MRFFKCNVRMKLITLFFKLYHTAFEHSFPLRTIGAKSKNIKREPWFSNGLLTSSKERAKLLTKNISKLNIHNFKIYNNIYNKLIWYMKISYFHNAFDENKHHIKTTWSIMRQAIGKINNKSSYPTSFMINETLVTDRTQVAEGFNNYFSMFPTLIKTFTNSCLNPLFTACSLKQLSNQKCMP